MELILWTILFACAWHVLHVVAYRAERRHLQPKDFNASATKSGIDMLQIALLGAGGFLFIATHAPDAGLAADSTFSLVVCAAMGMWAVDILNMVAERNVRWDTVLHHCVAAMICVFMLVDRSGAWLVAAGCFLAELAGTLYFAALTLKRLRLDVPRTIFAVRCAHFVTAALAWCVGVPALTLWFFNAVDFSALVILMGIGYNGFLGWSAYKLLTETPKTLRKMAAGLSAAAA